MTNQEYMEGLALQNEKQRIQLSMFNMIRDFREEGFAEEDIYDYMRDMVLNLMHGDTYKAIEDLLYNEDNNKSK
jgi:3-deoxy-D-arabino-heptulosonate 7-phosphate (DAHP) synthase class II